jgi:chondroitin AC lyase
MLLIKIRALVAGMLLLLPLSSAWSVSGADIWNRSSNSLLIRNASPDLEIIRQRVIEDLLAPPLDENLVSLIMSTIKPEGNWPDINYLDVSRTGFQHSRHLDNMFQLSRAYKKKESPWFQNPDLKNLALSALDYWLENDFICDNWWWNEMGTPGRMINTLLILDGDLNEHQIREGLRIAGRANLEASGARPGGDLIQIADMLGKQALFRRDETVLDRVVSVMADEIKVTTGRGLKPDMSFHHRVDNVICTLSYGLGYANSFSYWAVKIAGTKYRFPQEATELLIDYFLDGICKSMVHGRFPDPGAKNRDLSRKGTLDPAGPALAENLLKTSTYRQAELEEIVRIRKEESTPNLVWNRVYWHSEYVTHQRPGYFSSVRMHSARNHTMEQPHNEEGLKMHHVGDGSNFISRSGKEYLDIFPVWDWQKIPGTTVVQKPVHPHWKEIAKKGLTDFVGGVSNGKYGAVAMDFRSAHDSLRARKAWFFFDDEYVCLGTGITSSADHPVLTTINQCLLKGDVIVKAKKEEARIERGVHAMENVSWILHDGVGYVVNEREKLFISNTTATGNWRDINHHVSPPGEIVSMDVFSLWYDHGVKPANQSYEYIVVPGTESSSLDRYVRQSPIEIIENTQRLQAVRHKTLNIIQLSFYQPSKVKIGDNVVLSSDNACLVMAKTNVKSIDQLTVSDPTQKLTSLRLRTSVMIEGAGEGWKSVWDKKEKQSIIDIELPHDGYRGESVVIDIGLHQ